MQIGAGIWCGLAFIIAGILTISPGSPTILPLRKVMLIISIIFAIFLAFWAFSGAFIHAVIDTFDPFDEEYNENRLLRVIQGFSAVFEIVLAGVTFCQRTSEQEGQVTSASQILVTVQQGVWQCGLWSFQTGGAKLEIFLPKYQHTQRKLLNFEFWINGELSKSAKI